MITNRHFDEDDLALYVLRLLPEPQHAEVAKWIANNPNAWLLLLEVQTALAAFAEASVEPATPSEGSLERLMERVRSEPRRLAEPVLVPRRPIGEDKNSTPKVRSLSRWAGWAVAAMLVLTVGLMGQRWLALLQKLSESNGEVATLSADATNLRRERDTLQRSLAEQSSRADMLKSEAKVAQNGAANLQSKLTGQELKVEEEKAKAEEAERERSRLQGTVAAQGDQLAQLSAASRDAQVLAALTDPTALRVVLTKPKSKPAPTGRAAYVVSKGTLVFLGYNLPPLKSTKVYELWLMPADGSNPIPAGTFFPDANGSANLAYAQFPRAVAAKGFAVTIENAGGSQVPTLPIILAGL